MSKAHDYEHTLLKLWIATWRCIYADERDEVEMPWDLGGES